MSVNDSVALLKKYDPEIGAVVEEELERQRGGLELIASENVVSEAVMLAMGSPLMTFNIWIFRFSSIAI